MSTSKDQLISALTPALPKEVVEHLIDEYVDIHQHLALGKHRPSELNGGRFAECVLRLLQHLDNPPYTPFGTPLHSTDAVIRRVESNVSLHDSMRFHIPRLSRILLDVRNRRDVAHVGGDVSPNLSDSVFTAHAVDWILTELIRIFYSCSIDSARKIARSLNETKVPVVADVDGFVRVQNTSLDTRKRTLVILYYKSPASVSDTGLAKWLRYSNLSRFRKEILADLDTEALIHFEGGICTLLPKGVAYVEKNIPLELFI